MSAIFPFQPMPAPDCRLLSARAQVVSLTLRWATRRLLKVRHEADFWLLWCLAFLPE
jgi:hypothetical protein